MIHDDPEMDWVAERLPDVPEADPAATQRARDDFLTYLTAAQPEPEPRSPRVPGPLQNARQRWRTHRLGPPRRRAALLGAGALGVAAAVVVGVNLTGGSGGHGVGSPAVASAATIKARALSVLVPGPGGILEANVATVFKSSTGGGRPISEGYELWSMTGPPWAFRLTQTGLNGRDAQSAVTTAGVQQLYDPSTNTVEVLAPRYRFSAGPRPGTERLTVPAYALQQFANAKLSRLPAAYRHRMTTLTVTTAQVHELKLATASLGYGTTVRDFRKLGVVVVGHPTVQFHGRQGNLASQFTQPILTLLHSHRSTVNRHARLDGRPAIEITQVPRRVTRTMRKYGYTARTTYWIEPGTYRPLLSIQISVQPLVGGRLNDSTATTRFPRWRTLTGSAASPGLLSLSAQHPGARTIRVGQAQFDALSKKLYPSK